MRSDFGKKFKEKRGVSRDKFPRGNKKTKFRVNQSDEDSGPLHEGMGKAHRLAHHWRDGYRYNWSIARRMLAKHVGRPWDEVFSDICETSNGRTHEGRDLRWWVENIFVETQCKMINGKVYDSRGIAQINHYRTKDEFYVHPETKLLCTSPYVPWRAKKPKDVRPKVLELHGTSYHEHNGLWYRVKFKEWNQIETWNKMYGSRLRYYQSLNCLTLQGDKFIGEFFRGNRNVQAGINGLESKYGKDENDNYRFCIWKQAANSKEIANLKEKYQWD